MVASTYHSVFPFSPSLSLTSASLSLCVSVLFLFPSHTLSRLRVGVFALARSRLQACCSLFSLARMMVRTSYQAASKRTKSQTNCHSERSRVPPSITGRRVKQRAAWIHSLLSSCVHPLSSAITYCTPDVRSFSFFLPFLLCLLSFFLLSCLPSSFLSCCASPCLRLPLSMIYISALVPFMVTTARLATSDERM